MTVSLDNGIEHVSSARQWLRLSIAYLLIPFSLLLCGGDARWWQAWVYALVLVVAGVGGRVWAEQRHPGLMAERQSTATMQNAKAWDRILAPLMAVSLGYPLAVVAGLDHRYGWTASMPLWTAITGLVIVAIGYAMASWALIENRFFSSMVRIQTERGHVVCDSGPYRFVRHPGYAGNILALFGFVLAMSSIWTLVPALFATTVAVVRTVLEDKTLMSELRGYPEYARRVPFRLFPGIY